MSLKKAIIFAAGAGPDLKPWTDKHPKALAIVNGKTLLQRNIEYLQAYGIRDVIVSVSHLAAQVKDAVSQNKGWGSNVTISDETGTVLRTGGALRKAAWFFDSADPFIVMNVDMLTNLDLAKMIAFHASKAPQVTMAVTKRLTTRNFLFNDQGRLCGWINTQTGEQRLCRADHPLIPKAYSCINIFQPSVFSAPVKEGALSIIDLYLEVARHALVLGYDHSGDNLVDIGRPESITRAESLFH